MFNVLIYQFITTTLLTSFVVVIFIRTVVRLTQCVSTTLAPLGIIPLYNPYGNVVKPKVISHCISVNKNMC